MCVQKLCVCACSSRRRISQESGIVLLPGRTNLTDVLRNGVKEVIIHARNVFTVSDHWKKVSSSSFCILLRVFLGGLVPVCLNACEWNRESSCIFDVQLLLCTSRWRSMTHHPCSEMLCVFFFARRFLILPFSSVLSFAQRAFRRNEVEKDGGV